MASVGHCRRSIPVADHRSAAGPSGRPVTPAESRRVSRSTSIRPTAGRHRWQWPRSLVACTCPSPSRPINPKGSLTTTSSRVKGPIRRMDGHDRRPAPMAPLAAGRRAMSRSNPLVRAPPTDSSARSCGELPLTRVWPGSRWPATRSIACHGSSAAAHVGLGRNEGSAFRRGAVDAPTGGRCHPGLRQLHLVSPSPIWLIPLILGVGQLVTTTTGVLFQSPSQPRPVAPVDRIPDHHCHRHDLCHRVGAGAWPSAWSSSVRRHWLWPAPLPSVPSWSGR